MPPLIPISQLSEYAGGLDHPEGICLAPDGFVYVGGEAGQVYRVERDQSVSTVAHIGGFCLGLAADAESRLYVCDIAQHCVWRVTPSNGKVELFTAGSDELSMRSPNWGAFSADGSFFVSDSGEWGKCDGLIWRVTKDSGALPWSWESKNFPNGMALDAEGRTLFVLESYPAALVSFEIQEDGSAGPRIVITELEGMVPDGVAVTSERKFVVACYRPDVLLLIDQSGKVNTLAEDPRGTVLAAPTNVAFIGGDLSTMVVPNIGRWHVTSFELPGVSGIPLNYPSRDLIGS